MSTVTTDASPAPTPTCIAGQPVPRAARGWRLLQPDHVPLAVPGRVIPGWDIIYKIASRREEYCAAFGLVYKAYIRAGLSVRHPYRMRVTPYHLLPTSEVFIAVKEGEVISTVSLNHDGELGLPMESVYGEEVARFREHGYSVAEVSCMADHRQGQKRSVPVIMKLMSLMAQCAKRRGVDQLLIAVHPRHAKLYLFFAAFEPFGDEISTLGGAEGETCRGSYTDLPVRASGESRCIPPCGEWGREGVGRLGNMDAVWRRHPGYDPPTGKLDREAPGKFPVGVDRAVGVADE